MAGSRALLQYGALIVMVIGASFFVAGYVTPDWAISHVREVQEDSANTTSPYATITHGLWMMCLENDCRPFDYIPDWMATAIILGALAALILLTTFIVALLGLKYKSNYRYTVVQLVLNLIVAVLIFVAVTVHRVSYEKHHPMFVEGYSFYVTTVGGVLFVVAAFLNMCDLINGPRQY